MTKLFTSLLFGSIIAFPAMADSGSLTLHQANDEQIEFNLNEITNIRFADELIIINSAATEFKAATENITKITFSANTSVQNVITENKPHLRIQDNTLYVDFNCSVPGAKIYAVSGQCLFNSPNWTGEPIDITNLQNGVYILVLNEYTFKFVK